MVFGMKDGRDISPVCFCSSWSLFLPRTSMINFWLVLFRKTYAQESCPHTQTRESNQRYEYGLGTKHENIDMKQGNEGREQ